MQTLLETKPPQGLRREFTDNRVAQAILDFVTKFHNTFGILPSLRCKNLVADLENMRLELDDTATFERANKIRKKFAPLFGEKYGLKEGLVKQLDPDSIHVAIKILQETILPAYERSEANFTEKLKEGCKRLHNNYDLFIATSVGTPFVRITADARKTGILFKVMPTSEALAKSYSKRSAATAENHSIFEIQYRWMSFVRVEYVEAGMGIVTTLQRGKFFDDTSMSKQAFAPFGILEQTFLLYAAFSKRNKLFLPDSISVVEKWKHIFESQSKQLGREIRQTQFRIYDILGEKYGKHVSVLPQTKFSILMHELPVAGWRINLK